MVYLEESGAGAVENTIPVTPRENEDLLTMLRTRWTDGAFSDIKVNSKSRKNSATCRAGNNFREGVSPSSHGPLQKPVF